MPKIKTVHKSDKQEKELTIIYMFKKMDNDDPKITDLMFWICRIGRVDVKGLNNSLFFQQSVRV